MDLIDSLKQLSERILKSKELIHTEEATKHAYVMPFIQALGYDVFNPIEVVPEFIADIGIKIGEKVDYAIMKDNEPIILIECKHWSADLNPHNSQLFRYFHTTPAKFGLLTNGIEYRFYTDLVEPNKMDDKPFFTFTITDLKEQQVEEVKKFHKNYYDFSTIVNTASELKYLGEMKAIIHQEINDPSPDLTKFITKQIYVGIITQKLLDQFTLLTKKSFAQYINDQITERLKSALKKEEIDQKANTKIVLEESIPSKIITTSEELESYYIARSILRQIIPVQRIFYRDAQSYFSIILDDNNRKPICRMYLNSPTKKYLSTIKEDRSELKHEITTLDDMYKYAEEILNTAKRYLVEKGGGHLKEANG